MLHADGREETRDARALLRSSRREARPQPRAAGVDPQLPARLRVDEPERADVRELLLARIPNLDREDVVPAREAQQRMPPVARSPEVGDEHDERALARVRGDTGDPFTERGRAHAGARRLVPKGRKQPEQAHTPLPRGEHARLSIAEGDDPEPIPASGRKMPYGDRDSLGYVGLAPVGGPELHRRRRVEHEPRDEHALGEVDAHVRLVRPRGHVPVHPPDVVSGNVWTDERELRSLPEEYRPVVTGEEPLDAPPDAEVERTQERIGHRPGAWLRRCRRPAKSRAQTHGRLSP